MKTNEICAWNKSSIKLTSRKFLCLTSKRKWKKNCHFEFCVFTEFKDRIKTTANKAAECTLAAEKRNQRRNTTTRPSSCATRKQKLQSDVRLWRCTRSNLNAHHARHQQPTPEQCTHCAYTPCGTPIKTTKYMYRYVFSCFMANARFPTVYYL